MVSKFYAGQDDLKQKPFSAMLRCLPGQGLSLRFKWLPPTLVTILKAKFLGSKIPRLILFISLYIYRFYLNTKKKK